MFTRLCESTIWKIGRNRIKMENRVYCIDIYENYGMNWEISEYNTNNLSIDLSRIEKKIG